MMKIPILDEINQLVEHNKTFGRRANNIIMSNVTYSRFREEFHKAMGIAGDITMYLGLDIIVLDRDDLLLLVG